MKSLFLNLPSYLIALVLLIATSCKGQNNSTNNDSAQKENHQVKLNAQIGEYVVETFEDSKGNLWFGTLSKGVARYDGKNLRYFTMKDGLPSDRIVKVVEDSLGNLWFGTERGISKYDGLIFTNFSTESGLIESSVSNLLIDSKGIFWIGTWGGVFSFDGEKFTVLEIPKPIVNTPINPDTENWITELMEDSKGNIWIGRDGYGACKYNGKTFQHFLKSDGLYSNNVQNITEDKNGNIWFGSRISEKDNPDPNKRLGEGGVTVFDGLKYSHFPEIEGLHKNDVYEIYMDDVHNMWIGTIKNGAYMFDGLSFKNYEIPKPVMSFTKDKNGVIWIGCAGGLYKIKSEEIINVTTDGPWE